MNKKEALVCSKICRLTYVDEYAFRDFQLTARFENKGTDTQGVFGVAFDKALVIGFRGSEETGISDWITDLKFIKKNFPFAPKSSGLKVHAGFIEAYSSVRDAVLEAVKNSEYEEVYCTGHSLGGALAAICALDITYVAPDKKVTVYTFGSPKVGNAAFAELYHERVPNTIRVVNGSDGVPKVPPGNYHHVGILQEIGEISGSFAEILDTVMDHIPNAYIETLQKL
ncbi:MAG: lipase family protein [Anaerolineae bacterium]|nr:lipase family protein [Anaerolineae bacterium]